MKLSLPARTPEQLAPLLRAAQAFDRRGRRAEAIEVYREIVVGRPPQSLPSLQRLVDHLEASGRTAEALRIMMDAAQLWQDTGFLNHAHVMWKRATTMAPNDPAPLLGLARAALAHGVGLILADRALLQEGHQRLLAAGRPADAAELKSAAPFGPEDVIEQAFESRLRDLELMADTDRADEAIALADRIGVGADRVDVRARLRDIYVKCGDFTRAVGLSRAIARAHRAEGRLRDALAEDERADAIDPSRPAIWIKSARRSVRDGQPAEALRALDRAIPLASGPDRVRAWEMAGLAAALDDDEPRVWEAAAAMTRLDPDRARVFRAVHIDARRGGLRGDRVRVSEGVGSLEMTPRGTAQPWVPVGPGKDGTLLIPPGWELKVRMGGLEEEHGTPADLGHWPADVVAELDLSFSHIGDADLAPVARFRRLRLLSVDCVDMSWGLVPIDAKIGLKISNLFDDSRGRGVTSAGMAHVAGLTELRHLELGTSGIDDAALPHLVGLPNLEVLMLNRTQVQGHGLRLLADARVPLRELDLSRSGLTIDAIGILAGFRHLEVLHLDGLLVDGPRLDALRHLPLHTLRISRTTVDAADIVPLRRLRRLDLSGTSLVDADARHLAGLDRLALLIVRNTDFADGGLQEVARMPSLRRVSGTPGQFSEQAIARATAINPRLAIECTGQPLDLHLADEELGH